MNAFSGRKAFIREHQNEHRERFFAVYPWKKLTLLVNNPKTGLHFQVHIIHLRLSLIRTNS